MISGGRAPASAADEVVLHREDRGPGARRDRGLLVDVRDVGVHRRGGDDERRRDLLLREPPRKKAQDLYLPRRESRRVLRALTALPLACGFDDRADRIAIERCSLGRPRTTFYLGSLPWAHRIHDQPQTARLGFRMLAIFADTDIAVRSSRKAIRLATVTGSALRASA